VFTKSGDVRAIAAFETIDVIQRVHSVDADEQDVTNVVPVAKALRVRSRRQ